VGRGDLIDGWQVVHPEPGVSYSRADDGALCLRRELNGVRLLLLPDLGAAGQQSLATSGQDLRADVVIAGLPSEGEPLQGELLRMIQPQAVVISDSLFPATERVSRRTRERLSRSGCQVWYGSDVGPLQIILAKSKWKVVNAGGIAVEPQGIRE
jgi:beta-lactamase superfamily II metal-dependent hydrolase